MIKKADVKATRADYRVAAALVYEEMQHAQRECEKTAGEHAKWLIASLFLVNGGTLVGLFNLVGSLLQKSDKVAAAAIGTTATWFVGGLIFALACGFLTWVSYNAHSVVYRSWAKPSMLWDHNHWPDEKAGNPFTVWLPNYGAIVLGFLSVGLWVLGIVNLVCAARGMI